MQAGAVGSVRTELAPIDNSAAHVMSGAMNTCPCRSTATQVLKGRSVPVFGTRASPLTTRPACTTIRAAVDRGSSGIDIKGARPTSPRAWEVLMETLQEQKVYFISPQEAVFAQERGVPIVDVRPALDHYCSRIPGSVGIPFMRSITGNSFRQNLRRAGFAFFGIFNGTEFNPDFFNEVEQAIDKQRGAVLVCGIGGILEPLGRGGRQSRSLMAAYELASTGYQKVSILQGGFNEWERSGRPLDEDPIDNK